MSSGHHPVGGDQRSSASVSPLIISQVLQRDLWRKKTNNLFADPDTKNKGKTGKYREKKEGLPARASCEEWRPLH